jgi:hypothetical protein
MIVSYNRHVADKTIHLEKIKMNRARAVELSLLALKVYDQEDYVEQIYEIYNCICENKTYEDDPNLSKRQLITILENLTMNSRHCAKGSLKTVLYGNPSSGEIKRVRGLLENILFSEEDYY